jgi:hypothetical protein
MRKKFAIVYMSVLYFLVKQLFSDDYSKNIGNSFISSKGEVSKVANDNLDMADIGETVVTTTGALAGMWTGMMGGTFGGLVLADTVGAGVLVGAGIMTVSSIGLMLGVGAAGAYSASKIFQWLKS